MSILYCKLLEAEILDQRVNARMKVSQGKNTLFTAVFPVPRIVPDVYVLGAS